MWHNITLPKLLEELGANLNGLSEEEAVKRLKAHGPNILPERRESLSLLILRRQLASPFTVILGGAGLISFLLGHGVDAAVIFGALLLNIGVGFFQEYRAERAMQALKSYLPHEVVVVRGGTIHQVRAETLVAGDVVMVAAGDKIAADIRITDAMNLEINEASLTGESLPAKKMPDVLPEGTTLLEQKNMLFWGTVVTRGQGSGIVVATGKDTEFGKIAVQVARAKEEETPLQKRLRALAHKLTVVVIVTSFSLFVFGLLLGHPPRSMFTTAVAVAVAAVPEGLVVAVTVILAISMRRLLAQKALVKRLLAAETLGATTLVCVDKTGTVTEGVMRVSELHATQDIPSVKEELFRAMIFANEAIREEVHDDPAAKARSVGDPTDIALLDASIAAGFEPLYHEKQKLTRDILPFESENQFMAALVESGAKQAIYFKGAAEKLLLCSRAYLGEDGVHHHMAPEKRSEFLSLHDALSAKGLRLLAFARRDVSPAIKHISDLDTPLEDLVFLGFVALQDPLREGIKDAIAEITGAGVKLALITGDHVLTARTISAALGIGDHRNILIGTDLATISDEALIARVGDAAVFARTLPQQKLRIVDAFQASGHVVAMTGDGINDAPAMRAADIGIALGSGTDIAKETAEMVLLDNNFATLVAAIKEGRIIFENIKKVAIFLLFDSFSELVLVASALIFALLYPEYAVPLPLTAAMILWVNLIEDGPPVFGLAVEQGEKELMRLPPRSPKEPLLSKRLLAFTFGFGILSDLLPAALFVYLVTQGAPTAWIQTLMFAAIAIDSFTTIFAIRSLRTPVWRMNPFENKWIIAAVLFGVGMLVLATLVPFLQTILGTVPLSFRDWALIAAIGFANLLLLELFKWLFLGRGRTEGFLPQLSRASH